MSQVQIEGVRIAEARFGASQGVDVGCNGGHSSRSLAPVFHAQHAFALIESIDALGGVFSWGF